MASDSGVLDFNFHRQSRVREYKSFFPECDFIPGQDDFAADTDGNHLAQASVAIWRRFAIFSIKQDMGRECGARADKVAPVGRVPATAGDVVMPQGNIFFPYGDSVLFEDSGGVEYFRRLYKEK
jgi:hypothetical protein